MVRILHYSDIENGLDDPERAAKLAAALQEPEDAIIVGSGDMLAPSALANECDGTHTIPLFEAIQPDAETLGNHDFDHGIGNLEHIVRKSPQPWISANIDLPNVDTPASIVIERDGTKVGITGVSTPGDISKRRRGVRGRSPIKTAQQETQSLRRYCDYVVILSHTKNSTTTALAESTAADIVCAGHVSSKRIEEVENTYIVRPTTGAKLVTDVDLRERIAEFRSIPTWTPDTTVYAQVKKLYEKSGLNEVITHTETPIPRDREKIYAGDSVAAQFVSKATGWAANADIGVVDSGGIRSGPELVGDITIGEVRGIYPFQAPISIFDLSGKELEELVRTTIRPERDPNNPVHAYFSGLAVDWTDNGIKNITVDSTSVVGEQQYTVATSTYVARRYIVDSLVSEQKRGGPLYSDALTAYDRNVGLSHL